MGDGEREIFFPSLQLPAINKGESGMEMLMIAAIVLTLALLLARGGSGGGG